MSGRAEATAQPPCGRTETAAGPAPPYPYGSPEPSPGVRAASQAASARGLRPPPRWSHLALAALPTAPSCARLHTKQVLWEWGLQHQSEVSELIVSELVTNAVRITSARGLLTPIRLWLSHYGRQTLIEVWDGDSKPPRKQLGDSRRPELEESGRGLLLVESLSERWGWYPEGSLGGKVVWAVMMQGWATVSTKAPSDTRL
jgi:anti-sigma regulatory factor (Ser/Thr protein kinase)